MEFVPAVAMIALVWKLVDFAKLVRAGDRNAFVTQLVTWLAGIGVLLLVAQTVWAEGIAVGNQTLDKLNVASLIFVGLTIGSGASVFYDAKRSIDNTDSAAMPSLLPGNTASAAPYPPEIV